MENLFLNEVCRHSFSPLSPVVLTVTLEGAGQVASHPPYVGVDRGFSVLAVLTFGAGGFFFVGLPCSL